VKSNLLLLTSLAVALTLWACAAPEATIDAPWQAAPVKQYTFDEGVERDAAWSPDGQWIAYSAARQSGMNLWKRPVAGGAAVQLTSDSTMNVYPAWSPDGARLAFTSDRSGKVNIWILDADGGEPTRVTADQDSVVSTLGGGSQVCWSPDGKEIAFASNKGGSENIWTISATGGLPRQITRHASLDMTPNWSPDGKEIAFTSMRSGNLDLWVVAATGGQPRQITSHPGEDWWSFWSPDGKWLLFNSTRNGNMDLHIVAAAGGRAVPVTNTPEYNRHLS